MRFFALLDLQHLVLAFFLGFAAVIVLYLAFRYVPLPDAEEEKDAPPRKGRRRIPPVLIFLYAGFIVWFVAYVIMVGLKGGPM